MCYLFKILLAVRHCPLYFHFNTKPGHGTDLASWYNVTQRNSHSPGAAVACHHQEGWRTQTLLTATQGLEPTARQRSHQKESAYVLSQGNLHSPWTTPRKKTETWSIIINLYKLLLCFCKDYDISSPFLKTPRERLFEKLFIYSALSYNCMSYIPYQDSHLGYHLRLSFKYFAELENKILFLLYLHPPNLPFIPVLI